MTATPDVTAIKTGTTRDVVITIDTSGSYALLFHEKHPEDITSREYWAQGSPISIATRGEETDQAVCRMIVPDVAPNTTIHIKAQVASERVRQMHQPHTDYQETSIVIGELPAQAGTPEDSIDVSMPNPTPGPSADPSGGVPEVEHQARRIQWESRMTQPAFLAL